MHSARLVVGVIAFVAWSIALARPVGAGDSAPPQPTLVRVASDGAKAVDEFAAIPSDTPGVLILEEQSSFAPADTKAILKRMLERRESKGPTGVITKRARNGNSLVALGADVLVFVDGAKLEGADPTWLPANGDVTRSDLTMPLVRLLKTEALFPERFLSRDKGLSVNPPMGFCNDDRTGRTVLARKGVSIMLDQSLLSQVRQRVLSASSVDDGLKLMPGALAAFHATMVPSAPSAPPPAESKDPPAERDPSQEIARYSGTLRTLKDAIEKFHPLYLGLEGQWFPSHPSLRAVWRDGNTNMTNDGPTKDVVGDLQKAMRTCCSDLIRISNRTNNWTKGKHPQVGLLTSNAKTLEEFDKAIDKNDCEAYERLRLVVLELGSP